MRILVIAALLLGLVGLGAILDVAKAQSYPKECTATYGYSAACCRASYARMQQGTMSRSVRNAELAACTEKAKNSGRKEKK